MSDPRFMQSFQSPARGKTPLTETLCRVAQEAGGERPVLLFILTDGEPNGGVGPFKRELKRLVKQKSTPHEFHVQIMACTDDEKAIGWLNQIDGCSRKIDVTDDYFHEMCQVLKDARRRQRFTRGDWCMKAMLGPINARFDAMDEAEFVPYSDSDTDCQPRCAVC